ncbi:MAG: hypothetical protein ACRDQG_12160 [Pseudonocardiaceae bacterium]
MACTQAVRLLKDGRLRQHDAEACFDGAIVTVVCCGSRTLPAEARGMRWDTRNYWWVPADDLIGGDPQ